MTKIDIVSGFLGAGKTTLGQAVAKELGYTFVDIDEYIWRKDTKPPFSVMYSKTYEIINRTFLITFHLLLKSITFCYLFQKVYEQEIRIILFFISFTFEINTECFLAEHFKLFHVHSLFTLVHSYDYFSVYI